MQDAKTYLSTAPVLATLWFRFLAGLLIKINRFFLDALILPFYLKVHIKNLSNSALSNSCWPVVHGLKLI